MARSSKGAFSESEGWSVDVDTNTTNGTIIVAITGPSFYVDFWATDLRTLVQAAAYLRSEKSTQPFRLGNFSSGLPVEFTTFGEGQSIFVAVSEAEGSVMSYKLSPSDLAHLGSAFENAAGQLRV